MENLRLTYFEETLAKIPKLREALSILKSDPKNKTCQKVLHFFFHTVYGSGTTIGLNEHVEAARSFEDRLSVIIDKGQAVEADFHEELENMVNFLEKRINLLKTVDAIVLPGEPEQPIQEIPRKEILVVDDDCVIRQFIADELTKRNFGVVGAGDANEAKKILERYRPDLIILDIVMPGTNGLELLNEVRVNKRFKWTPIFLLTSKSRPAEIIEGIKTGADDYILKPVNIEDLVARIETKISRMEELHGMAVRDPLTGAFTRGYFMERLNEEIGRYSRQQKPFSIVMCDLDFFKSINDKHGHQVGDYVLQQFAVFLYNTFRRTDTIGRYGGEEFILLFPETDALTAYKLMERLRTSWEKKELTEPYQNKQIKVSFSAGIGEFHKDGNTGQEIIGAADRALYQAKATGRNKILLADSFGSQVPVNPFKIMIVDDSAVIRSILERELKSDYELFLATDGEDALLRLHREKPDLIIADQNMPKISGLELVKKIKENPKYKNIKIMLLTSDNHKKTVMEAYQLGIHDYIVKPFNNQEIKARILRLLKAKDMS